jgi:hypothetical protein
MLNANIEDGQADACGWRLTTVDAYDMSGGICCPCLSHQFSASGKKRSSSQYRLDRRFLPPVSAFN